MGNQLAIRIAVWTHYANSLNWVYIIIIDSTKISRPNAAFLYILATVKKGVILCLPHFSEDKV